MENFIKPEKRKGVVIIAAITLIIIIIFIGRGQHVGPIDYVIVTSFFFFLGILACSVYLYGIYPLIGAVIGGIASFIWMENSCPTPAPAGDIITVVECPDFTPYFVLFLIAGWILGLIIAILIKRIKEKKQI